jgi:methylmalonyl-CoA mutase
MSQAIVPTPLKNNVRIVTSTALFDGHDASINIIRRMLQEFGAEVIHLGHNRSVQDVVKSVLQEGAQGVCISSYQGGHMEYFKYLRDALNEAGACYVQIYGGGGGVIIHDEKKELEAYGIAQIFHPDDGRRLGLEGMIKMIVNGCDFNVLEAAAKTKLTLHKNSDDVIPSYNLGVALNHIELENMTTDEVFKKTHLETFKRQGLPPIVLGITGTGGAGKSSLIDELAQRFLNAYPDKNIAIVCVDPSKKKTGGALLGDRIRMNSLSRPHIFMRSVASRGSGKEIATSLPKILDFLKQCDFDFIIAETSGIGQGNMAITEVSDLSMYVMTSDFGAQSQLEKIDMIDFADFVAVNKADRRGALDAVRDVTKQYKRSRKIFDDEIKVPVFLTQASQFNDRGVNQLFFSLVDKLNQMGRLDKVTQKFKETVLSAEEHVIIPSDRQAYLAEIVGTIKSYKQRVTRLAENASRLGALNKLKNDLQLSVDRFAELEKTYSEGLTSKEFNELNEWNKFVQHYTQDELVYSVRGKEFRQPMVTTSLSGTKIRKISLPTSTDWGDRFKYLKLENVPGEFPFTAGVFPLKRTDEDPKRMFAGEGTPERTNQRFHYLCKGEMAHRLSTAFDSVTLYGQDPHLRPDIYGKIGESGVSICTLNDMKKLFKGFDLISPNTSVSMTINGPAPIILAFYFNTAIDEQIEIFEKKKGRKVTDHEYETIKKSTLKQIRGTVQADILKEDQGQNTCIFSTNFALKMMGDTQEYFTKNDIKNFYSVSISGYHIAEAGANPISQLAFTLSNGFTFVEYYLSRGLKIDDFAPNLSFFFSNGLDAEYSVLGRVARRIWAVAMRDLYKANDRSQKLKYHIQTSGRSLHAQEIDFNDIRTTLQALLALNDNCNSLHTNAYDEAITTPTEESVRRAMAIQMIINREFGISKNENINQGSYFLEELTDIVEEAVLAEFKKISDRGGVLGAMETQYQRSKIQEESMYYEHLKHSGELPIIGVNTFIDPKTLTQSYIPPKIEMARASVDEKNHQLNNLNSYINDNKITAEKEIINLKMAALAGQNIFEALLSASRHCSLYQMSQALYEVGGQYRRNL